MPLDDETQELIAELEIGQEGDLRPPKPVFHIQFVRDLTEADLAAPLAPMKPPHIARLRASHHALARCLATGMKQSQASLVTGYSEVRISILQSDPAFQALLTDYRTEAASVFASMSERMHDLSLDALEIMQERLHDAPENFTISTLLELIKSFADRTGFGPGSQINLRVERDPVDRPPRESFEEWAARRARELSPSGASGDKIGGDKIGNNRAASEAASSAGEAPSEPSPVKALIYAPSTKTPQ